MTRLGRSWGARAVSLLAFLLPSVAVQAATEAPAPASAPAAAPTSSAGPAEGRFKGTLAWIRLRFPGVAQLSTRELADWLADTGRPAPVLIDVRERAEFEVSHLAGARHVEPGADPAVVLSDLDPRTPIVAYCSVGYRSSACAAQLRKAGFTEVANLEGSIFRWVNEGRPVVAADGSPTRLVHPFDADWGGLLKPEHRAALPAP